MAIDWRMVVGAAALVVAVAVAALRHYFQKPEDPEDEERRRRSQLNQVGRIVEGLVVELVEIAGVGRARTQFGKVYAPQGRGFPTWRKRFAPPGPVQLFHCGRHLRNRARRYRPRRAPVPRADRFRPACQREVRSVQSQQFDSCGGRLVRSPLDFCAKLHFIHCGACR